MRILGWVILISLGVMLVMVGTEGRLGSFLAAFFAPNSLQDVAA